MAKWNFVEQCAAANKDTAEAECPIVIGSREVCSAGTCNACLRDRVKELEKALRDRDRMRADMHEKIRELKIIIAELSEMVVNSR